MVTRAVTNSYRDCLSEPLSNPSHIAVLRTLMTTGCVRIAMLFGLCTSSSGPVHALAGSRSGSDRSGVPCRMYDTRIRHLGGARDRADTAALQHRRKAR